MCKFLNKRNEKNIAFFYFQSRKFVDKKHKEVNLIQYFYFIVFKYFYPFFQLNILFFYAMFFHSGQS